MRLEQIFYTLPFSKCPFKDSEIESNVINFSSCTFVFTIKFH